MFSEVSVILIGGGEVVPKWDPGTTSSGGHRKTYGLYAGGTHTTGMLACLFTFILKLTATECISSKRLLQVNV